MQQFLTAIRMIPAAGRLLGGLLISLMLVFMLARLLKIPSPYRWFLLVGVVVAFGIFYLIGKVRKSKEKRDAREFEGSLGLQSREAGVGKEEIREALAELSQKWEEAVKEFRAAGMSIYDLPWYLLIGEPQSGKSTTIQNSGLEFPVGTDALSGSGGTRNCDWWFTNEAVILDTAGRFTFQEANAPDQHEWNTFLKLLCKHRKRCPINGVIVVIPVTSLVEDAIDVIETKAKNIRQKLRHLQQILGIRFPVFVLVTKADRILGFTEFFSKLDPIDQRQLFGWSSQTSQATPWDGKEYDKNFHDIFRRVHKLRLKFFHGEEDASKIDKLFVFPEELLALREPLANYLTTIFSGSRFEEPLMLRGYYFTSGIQQGRPFALACKELLRVHAGDPEGVLENLEQVFSKSRAFFIRDFYEKKVFPEQGLVAKTRETVQKEKLRRRILLGGGGLLLIILIPLLVWAFSALRTTVGAITENVRRAEKCLDGSDPCSAKQAYDLIQALENNKTDLQRKWLARWMFLKGRNNPVVVRYIPAAQAALLNEKIIGPLQASFDTRAGKVDWIESPELYLTFREAFVQLLRFKELGNPMTDEVHRERLRSELRIEPLLAFCSKTADTDDSEDGKIIDDWLLTDVNAPTTTDQMFAAVIRQFPKVADDNSPLSDRGAREAMLRFWTVDSLAGWDYRLLRVHFEDGFVGFFRRVEGLDVSHAPDRAATVGNFVELVNQFDNNWSDAVDLMGRGRPATGSAEVSPGVSPDQWRAHCLKDFNRVFEVSENTYVPADYNDRCEEIPGDFAELEREWQQFDYLFEGSPDANAEEKLAWAEDAVKVYNAVVVMRKGFSDAEIKSFHDELNETLSRGLGVKHQLDEIETVQKGEVSRFIQPVDDVAKLELPVFAEMARAVRPAAELGIAERVLPPVSTFFVDVVFDPENTSLLTADRAKDNVPTANEFLVWAQRHLGEVDTQPTTEHEITDIDNAVYRYVQDLVEIEIGSLGGGGSGGPFFVKPRSASNARSWRAFVDAVSSWNHVGRSRGGGSGPSTGIDSRTLDGFAQQNARLEGLSRQFRDAQRKSQPSPGGGGPVVPSSVERAINAFKDLVGRLDTDPLEAWRELAEKPENLQQFHAFSRLGGGRHVADLERDLEVHGANILESEIAPVFQRSYKDFWRDIDEYAFGFFPFISKGQLEDARSMYSRGYSRSDRQSADEDSRDRRRSRDEGDRRSRRSSADASWQNRTSDSGQRLETMVLNLPTVSAQDAEDVFSSLQRLVDDYGLTPILNGSEREIDFVGIAKSTLTSMQGWAGFMGGGGSRRQSQEESFEARLLPQLRHGDGTFLLEKVNSIEFFGAQRPIRSSTEQYVEVPLNMTDGSVSVVGVNEDQTSGWTGRLIIEGGAFKILYFVLVAADGAPSDDRTTWEVRVELPAHSRSGGRLDGIFELSFDRPIPAVLPANAGREYD